jgi:hypothetical protein
VSLDLGANSTIDRALSALRRIQDFKLGGRAEGGANIFGVFRMKNHDFTPNKLIFSNFRGGARRMLPPRSAPVGEVL